jgi:hypothetical protein
MRERYSRSIQSSGIIIIVKLNILNIWNSIINTAAARALFGSVTGQRVSLDSFGRSANVERDFEPRLIRREWIPCAAPMEGTG